MQQQRRRGPYALVDCNNFFVSCERVFEPGLRNAPAVVLSNNDGCVIARSPEAKALGIAMCEPAFLREAFFARHGVRVFSSNYALYGDMSRRVMQVLERFDPGLEIYSIDEAFLRLPPLPGHSPQDRAAALRETVRRWTGITVSVGLGSTKTLAKVANRVAKKDPASGGVFDLCAHPDPDAVLAGVPVGDVWGVGGKSARKLAARGVASALGLRDLPDLWLRRALTVAGLLIAWELRGRPCIPLERAPAPRKSIVTSRSFGRPVTTWRHMAEAVATYTARAAEKLRAEGGRATQIMVFLTTNPHRPEDPQYSNSHTASLPGPTAHTPTLLKAAHAALETVYRPGYSYKKAGIILAGIENGPLRSLRLPIPGADRDAGADPRGEALMRALDAANRRWGRGALAVADALSDSPWKMRQSRKSPRYTTCWDELPVAG